MIEEQMVEYIKTNEVVLNDLMAEYWNLRHDVGECLISALRLRTGADAGYERQLHGNAHDQIRA